MKFQTLNNWQQRMIIPKKGETDEVYNYRSYCLERVSRLQHGTQPHPSSLSSRGDRAGGKGGYSLEKRAQKGNFKGLQGVPP